MIEQINNSSASSNPVGFTPVSDKLINARHEVQTQNTQQCQVVAMDSHPQSVLMHHYKQHLLQQQHVQQVQPSQIMVFGSNRNNDGISHSVQLNSAEYSHSFVINEYSSSCNQSDQDAVMNEASNTSDTSNQSPEETNPDADILPNDDPYTYLQELNSDNLMQFSQQSAIQELMLKEHLDIKPNLDVLPTFEEHDIGGYKFCLKICSKRKGKINWVYSEALNKVYIRMNEIFTVDAVYTPKLPLQQLRIRMLMCFVKEVSEPVVRCQNHISKDTEPHPMKRHSLLRCENPSAEYCGTAEGKSINDRYSIVIPLGPCAMPKNDNSIAQTIALKFTCQNSCIGRKETSIIFLLEGMNGEILSQRVLDMKICSCPKRDNEADERNSTAVKRKSSEDVFASEPKMIKKDTNKNVAALLREDRSSSDLDKNNSQLHQVLDYDIQPTPGGGCRLIMELGSKDVIQKVVTSACDAVASKIIDDPNNAQGFKRRYRKLKRLHERTLKMSWRQ